MSEKEYGVISPQEVAYYDDEKDRAKASLTEQGSNAAEFLDQLDLSSGLYVMGEVVDVIYSKLDLRNISTDAHNKVQYLMIEAKKAFYTQDVEKQNDVIFSLLALSVHFMRQKDADIADTKDLVLFQSIFEALKRGIDKLNQRTQPSKDLEKAYLIEDNGEGRMPDQQSWLSVMGGDAPKDSIKLSDLQISCWRIYRDIVQLVGQETAKRFNWDNIGGDVQMGKARELFLQARRYPNIPAIPALLNRELSYQKEQIEKRKRSKVSK